MSPTQSTRANENETTKSAKRSRTTAHFTQRDDSRPPHQRVATTGRERAGSPRHQVLPLDRITRRPPDLPDGACLSSQVFQMTSAFRARPTPTSCDRPAPPHPRHPASASVHATRARSETPPALCTLLRTRQKSSLAVRFTTKIGAGAKIRGLGSRRAAGLVRSRHATPTRHSHPAPAAPRDLLPTRRTARLASHPPSRNSSSASDDLGVDAA